MTATRRIYDVLVHAIAGGERTRLHQGGTKLAVAGYRPRPAGASAVVLDQPLELAQLCVVWLDVSRRCADRDILHRAAAGALRLVRWACDGSADSG